MLSTAQLSLMHQALPPESAPFVQVTLQTPALALAQRAPNAPAALALAKPPSPSKGKRGHLSLLTPQRCLALPAHPLLGGVETQRPERSILFPSPDFPSAHAVGRHPATDTEQER